MLETVHDLSADGIPVIEAAKAPGICMAEQEVQKTRLDDVTWSLPTIGNRVSGPQGAT